MLAKNLVVELSPYNISVNTVAPGATLTERTLTLRGLHQCLVGYYANGQTSSTVADIANAALFLLSPASRQITGQTLSLLMAGGPRLARLRLINRF
jgi:glucose 1-dehydrogenase